jgi:ferric-dicitrate binding protein FerR (iron transport regulator)
MNQEQLTTLLNRYKEGALSPGETALLETWYIKESAREKLRLTEEEVELISQNIRTGLPLADPEPVRVRLWPKIAVAVAISTIVIGAGIWFLSNKSGILKQVQDDVVMNDVAPGRQGATLTLASGKKIRLSDARNGEIAKEAGIKVSKTADGQLVYEVVETRGDLNRINTLSTEKGETYVLTLPDQSKVWLNAASSLTYSASLNENGIRKVKLTGEAFFKVAKDKLHPFVVQTAHQEVEVLGTEFNINSYPDESAIATTLVEGSVKVRSDSRQRTIVPGEQLTNNGTDFKVAKVNLDNVVDWKDGEFNLDGLPFRVAMRKIARWYDIEVVYDGSVPDNIISGGWISRDVKLSVILDGIERSKLVKFKLEGKKLYVSK